MAILPTVRKVVAQMDPDVPLIQPILQREQFERTISQQLMFARLAEFFGVLAIVLVATGTVRDAVVSGEYAHGGDWCAHGGGSAAESGWSG